MKANLTIQPGGQVQGLYTEIIDLHALGRLLIRRATTIEYEDARQAWIVRDPAGTELFDSPSRQTCLDWEQQYFNPEE